MTFKHTPTQDLIRIWDKKDIPQAIVTYGTIRPGLYPMFALLGWVQECVHQKPIVL